MPLTTRDSTSSLPSAPTSMPPRSRTDSVPSSTSFFPMMHATGTFCCCALRTSFAIDALPLISTRTPAARIAAATSRAYGSTSELTISRRTCAARYPKRGGLRIDGAEGSAADALTNCLQEQAHGQLGLVGARGLSVAGAMASAAAARVHHTASPHGCVCWRCQDWASYSLQHFSCETCFTEQKTPCLVVCPSLDAGQAHTTVHPLSFVGRGFACFAQWRQSTPLQVASSSPRFKSEACEPRRMPGVHSAAHAPSEQAAVAMRDSQHTRADNAPRTCSGASHSGKAPA
eukprot:359137-Chlamydomonas_euryale.AAC.6